MSKLIRELSDRHAGLADAGSDGSLALSVLFMRGPTGVVTPGGRAAYHRMMNDSARVRFNLPMAASDDELVDRIADGALIRFSDSAANPDMIYMIIELQSDKLREQPPTKIMLFNEDDEVVERGLPDARNGVIQILLSKDDQVILLLRQPSTDVVLR